MLTAYIAAPLFCEAEKTFNLAVDAALRAADIDTYLPQRDGGEGVAMVAAGADPVQVRQHLFTADVNAVRRCDLLVMLLDGRVPDEGACVELGLAYAWGKPCFGLQTDTRRFVGQSNNLMIDSILTVTTSTLDELVAEINQYFLVLPTVVA
ncbi:nucleoside 2-deoxyribosyltransferase [Amycolatopsis cihanbeyliensis]|uniref:Nucleoside 2-deoxyribosyltransferase-like protein n=1 Tax=Amycolatopsis cihanbeyliensis TaxID=1128664 RepID=A0A542DPR6_AMYCI|nr:nucleoside 2-deoxyribosyltransferase [Amycolatopsis cihanbeyliensis]TQJ05091.1 nucleoside 2-deoxyribosyltransferase-like protein [Amycolatopsis cihanbeyliensis]